MQTTISHSRGLAESVQAKKALLICGIASSLLYVLMNIFVPMKFEEYSLTSQTVSELSAIGAASRPLWVLLAMGYMALFAAFGWGIINSAGENRRLHTLGWLIIIYCIINLYWPPMHLRGTEPSLTDTLHIVWSGVTVLLMMVIMVVGAASLGRWFRLYTIATLVLLTFFGYLTARLGPNIALDLPTPFIGVWERILIALFMLWVVVLAFVLLRRVSVLESAEE